MHPHRMGRRATRGRPSVDSLTIRILTGGTDVPGGPPPVEVPSPGPPHPPGDAPGRGPETPEPGVPMPEPDDPVPPVTQPDPPGTVIDRAPITGTSFCALCWGAGRILGPAANGEGLIPVACAHCGGTGTV